jgi:zinc protease
VDDIEDRFGSAEPRSDSMPARADTTFDLEQLADFALHSDPDQTTVDVEVDLPLPALDSHGTAGLRASILDTMIYSALIRRLDQDVTAGTAPFDDITTGTNSFVPSLDAPALYAFTDAERVDATLRALLDEYERADRFGFTAAETDVARSAMQAQFDAAHERRNTTQDTELAEQYVANFLYGEPYPSADDLHELATGTIDAITPEALTARLRARWRNTAPHVIISTPLADESAMPSRDEVLAAIDATPERELEPRADGRQLPDELMVAPEPVAPASRERLIDDASRVFDPIEVVFPNGARVIATSNDIVEGQFGFQASSPGGSSLVADEDVVDALYAAEIVTSSGVGEFNQTELEAVLADRSVGVAADITPYLDTFQGGAATADLETLFQLIHLYMTQPRFDPVALSQLQRFEGPLVNDPASDPDAAGFDALLDARYPDEPRYTLLPTPEQFATLDLEGVERVWRDRFGDASDWVFVFAGDLDLDELFDLAGRYIATLPATGEAEHWVDVEDPPPPGVVRQVVGAGTGETASLTMLFTSPVAGVDSELRATSDVVVEVVNTRLTDVVRERLGESYSPFAVSFIGNDPDPVIETYLQVTGSPERIESVAGIVAAELADLAANGPTEREFDTSTAQVGQAYQFVDNETFLTELTNDAIWPDRELDDYLGQFDALPSVTASSVQAFIAAYLPADRFIQVAVLPR